MKRYLPCLFIIAMLFVFSCATAPVTPPVETPPTQPQPSTPAPTTPSPGPTPGPVVTQPQVTLIDGLDMSGAAEYTIIPGDFLSEITRTFYGNHTGVGPAGTKNGFYFPVLMLASNGQIEDPDLIFPDTRLRIPDLVKNLANPDSRRTIKTLLAQAAILYRNKALPDEAEGLQRLADWL